MVTQAYSLEGKTLEKVVRGHIGQTQSLSWPSLNAVSVTYICCQACWQSTLIFAKQDKRDLPESVSECHGDSVLRAAAAKINCFLWWYIIYV